VAWLPVPGAQEAIGTDYGLFLSGRLPAGFGGEGTAFHQDLALLRGVSYQVRVRAIRTTGDSSGDIVQAHGLWSEEVPFTLAMDSGEPAGPQVPWPARPVPPINTAIQLFAEFDDQEQIGRVEIGTIPPSVSVAATVGLTQIGTNSLDPLLTVPLPLVVYRHDTANGHRAEMTQISHFMDRILTQPAGQMLQITDGLILVKRRNNEPNGPYRLWIRDTQPVMGGRSYIYTVVRHSADREIIEVLASNNTQIPL
jgi:hypothetical protein